jgi:hypothetical protein
MKQVSKGIINPRVIAEIVKKGPTTAEGCKNALIYIREGLEKGWFTPYQFSFKDVGLALGAIDPYDMGGSFRRVCAEACAPDIDERRIFSESNPTLMSNAFQIITGELIARMVIEGYESEEGYIGDQLVDVMPNQRMRNQRITGLTALAGPLEVSEGHPYSETGFGEKYVTTQEVKVGRVLSLTEELMLFDQLGAIRRQAMGLGQYVRQYWERKRVRAVIDADSSTDPVYRPSGSGETLYATDGSNQNYIGSGGVTGFSTAVPLVDWTDVNEVLKYRALKVKDDRVDGDQQVIFGLNGPQNVLLVPEALRATAWYIKNQTAGEKDTNPSAGTVRDNTHFGGNPVQSQIGGVLSSPFIDEVNSSDWYYGNPKKQFVETEIYGLQTFTLGRESADMFERDVALRIKVRKFSGISATDTVYVTKVDGQ